ncbi:MAG: hypothetical protein WA803_17325 [Steroidobacteraceae bacterium]
MFITSRRARAAALAVAIAAAAGWNTPASAQNTPGTHQDNSGLNGSLSREDLDKLGGDHKQDTGADSKDSAASRAKATAQSIALLQSMKISCDVNDAKLVVSGTRKPKSGGREVETRVYEVACRAGMGYLLETQGTELPMAISCLSAEEARAADVAKGSEPSYFCKLPENTNVYGLVTSMIAAGSGAQCEVRTLQSFGHSESTHSDYSEVACTDGKGFMLRVAQPGSEAQNTAMSCQEAAKQGIKCKLTDAGPVEAPVTLQTFKDVLARNGVTCNVGKIRLIGQEDHLKRYVVEYRCADQPAGRVAFLPLPGNANPYESLDCATALSASGVTCEFTP